MFLYLVKILFQEICCKRVYNLYLKIAITVPKNPLGLGILGKPPGDYSNGRDLTLTVRGYSLAIMSASIEAASLTLGKINPIVRGICLTLRQLHKRITLKLEYIP